MPIEPPPSRWEMPTATDGLHGEVVGVGADLEPATLLAAYRAGLFPMRLPDGRLAWWSPDPRGVLPLDGLHVSRSLRRACRRYTTTIDTAFVEVVRGCADPRRPGTWIDDTFVRAYTTLHELGWAHSVEVWDDTGDAGHDLVGGLYGVAIGGLFAAESKFHRARDASKVALVALVRALQEGGASLLDVQWTTPHLATLGVVDVTRQEYATLLRDALARPPAAVFDCTSR